MRLIHLFLIVLLLGVSACSGSSTEPSASGSGSGSGTVNGTIDGMTWTVTSVTATMSSTTPPYLGLSAGDAALNLFSFAMGPSSGAFGVATYKIGASGNNANYVLPGGAKRWTAVGNTGSGQVTITAFSAAAKTVSGTFTFVLVSDAGDTKTVTGSFNVTYK